MKENGTLYMVAYVDNEPDLSKLRSIEGFLEHHLRVSRKYKSKENYQENSEENIEDGFEVPILGNEMLTSNNFNSSCWFIDNNVFFCFAQKF